MSSATLASEAEQIQTPPDSDCRVFERHSTELSIQCQPLAARGDNDIMWPATARDLSAGGIGLVLRRRFEPRTGLSLSLPEPGTDSTYTVFVRVVRVEPLPEGRWLLGCSFVTPLTEERLSSLLQAAQAAQAPPAPPVVETAPPSDDGPASVTIEKVVVMGVLFQVRHGTHDPIRRKVTRLHVSGRWPLATGRAMKVWVGSGPRNESAADIRVNGCYKQDGRWLIDCYFLGPPPQLLLEKLQSGQM